MVIWSDILLPLTETFRKLKHTQDYTKPRGRFMPWINFQLVLKSSRIQTAKTVRATAKAAARLRDLRDNPKS